MPTGYTAGITDSMPFRDFALQCARASGALVLMRDDPADAVIPDEFKVSDYHTKAVAEAEARVAELTTMDDATKELRSRETYQAAMRSHAESLEESRATRRRYERMLDEAKRWKPPTPDHVGLRDFMIQQLEESIRFDCWEEGEKEYRKPPKYLAPGDWWAGQVADAERTLAYQKRSLTEETERQKTRTEWVRQLRVSLGVTARSEPGDRSERGEG
jgi:hypothetical protein